MRRARWSIAWLVPLAVVVGCGDQSVDQVAGLREPTAPSSAGEDFNTESYDHIVENDFLSVARNPLSTFSVDVDTASYSNTRRFLDHGQLPPPGAVRIEELVNYFSYEYPRPDGEHPFSVTTNVTTCPWQPEHDLVRIGLKGEDVTLEERGDANLVLLLDVSGSMQDHNKLPYVKRAMEMLVGQLQPHDRVAIVTYAGSTGVALPSTPVSRSREILAAVDGLLAGGSTNGAGGIRAAYDIATEHFVEGGVNRVILCTDGDFNIGITDQSQLVRLIEDRAKSGVFLSVLGFGMGNYQDSTMEKLADHGNGNYAYVDSLNEARKVLVEQLTGTLVTIAKDVKIQVDFNPARVRAYRLIGYENRLLNAEDFKDDTKDAGEIGAGHTVTALYEIVPPDVAIELPEVEPSKYAVSIGGNAEGDDGRAGTPALRDGEASNELLTVRLRYKQPNGDESTGFDHPLSGEPTPFGEADDDVRFAASVAAFGMILRDSKYRGTIALADVSRIAAGSAGDDPHGYRAEFVTLVNRAIELGADD